MEIVDCEQGSKLWHELRSQRMTGSHAQAIGSNGKGLDSYIIGLMQKKYSSAEMDNYKSDAMQRGNDLEDSAIFAYESEKNVSVEKVGFVILNEHVGVSPDGFIGSDGLIEVKCPSDKVYFKYLLDGKIDTGYEWQMQMQMLICEKEWCDYVVYNPHYKKSLIVNRIHIDAEKVEKLKQGFFVGIDKINEIKDKMKGVL